MPGRDIPLVNNEIYHVFNRTIQAQPLFGQKSDYKHFLLTCEYYLPCNQLLRYSHYAQLTVEKRSDILAIKKLKNEPLVDVLAYCLMPNHFHMLLKQRSDLGISKYLSKICNSYTRYLNTKKHRFGPILQGKFKAKRIETMEQLLHVSRYIHLNPYTSFVTKSMADTLNFDFSSMPEYLGKRLGFSNTELIFANTSSAADYEQFVVDNADYQRNLGQIKHLLFE